MRCVYRKCLRKPSCLGVMVNQSFYEMITLSLHTYYTILTIVTGEVYYAIFILQKYTLSYFTLTNVYDIFIDTILTKIENNTQLGYNCLLISYT